MQGCVVGRVEMDKGCEVGRLVIVGTRKRRVMWCSGIFSLPFLEYTFSPPR